MYLCIDVGGTKTLVASFSRFGKLQNSIKFPTAQDQLLFYTNLVQQIRNSFDLSKLIAISVAMPGLVRNNRVEWLGNLPWTNFDIASQLSADFGCQTVYVTNDADLGALAESQRTKDRTLYLTFSTGIGGGVVEEKHLLANYAAFEPGHIVLPFNNTQQEWEDFASAHAIRAFYGKLASEITDPAAWTDIAQRIAIGLAPLIIAIQPKRVVFGGPLGLQLRNYENTLSTLITPQLPEGRSLPKFTTPKYEELSPVYGCYFRAKQKAH